MQRFGVEIRGYAWEKCDMYNACLHILLDSFFIRYLSVKYICSEKSKKCSRETETDQRAFGQYPILLILKLTPYKIWYVKWKARHAISEHQIESNSVEIFVARK